MPAPKLVLCVVDSMRSESLREAIAEGAAPTLAGLVDRGVLVEDCVSAFPSVTPVCCASIATGAGPDEHRIPGMSWFHRGEDRYVEYGSSLAATRTVGFIRSLYDTVYNMNLSHLNPHLPTLFERLGDEGIRTACTPFLIYRGRRRHPMGLEGVLRRVAVAADFQHAVWGPDELFWGELYASRRAPCRPTLARPMAKDGYSACVGEFLVEQDLFDFLLFSLPDNDYYSHRYGPVEQVTSLAAADRHLTRLVDAAGGLDAFLEDHAVIVMADHSQTRVDEEVALAGALDDWSVLEPGPASRRRDRPQGAELAVSPSGRAAGIYVLREDRRRAIAHRRVRDRLGGLECVDLVAWLGRDGDPLDAMPRASDLTAAEVAVRRGGAELRFRPGSSVSDLRGRGWDVEGDPAALDAEVRDGRFASASYPDALTRLWDALAAPAGGDLMVSLAEGWECADLGGSSHVPGGSHGSLAAGDSLAPALFVGTGPDAVGGPEEWTLRDIAGVVCGHFGVDPPDRR